MSQLKTRYQSYAIRTMRFLNKSTTFYTYVKIQDIYKFYSSIILQFTTLNQTLNIFFVLNKYINIKLINTQIYIVVLQIMLGFVNPTL